jgi:hypothetical protein
LLKEEKLLKELRKHSIDKSSQIYMMKLSGGYRNYFSYGYSLEKMAQNVAKLFSKFCEVKRAYSLKEITQMEEDYSLNVYIVNLDDAFDDEYFASSNKSAIFLGDYLETLK